MQKRTTWVNSVILTFSQQNEKTLATIQNEFRENLNLMFPPTHTAYYSNSANHVIQSKAQFSSFVREEESSTILLVSLLSRFGLI